MLYRDIAHSMKQVCGNFPTSQKEAEFDMFFGRHGVQTDLHAAIGDFVLLVNHFQYLYGYLGATCFPGERDFTTAMSDALDVDLDELVKKKNADKPKPVKKDAPAKKEGGGGKVKTERERHRASPVGRRDRDGHDSGPRRGAGPRPGGGGRDRDRERDRDGGRADGAWRHDKFASGGPGAPFVAPMFAAPGGYYPYGAMPMGGAAPLAAPAAAAAGSGSRAPISLGVRVLVTNLDPEISAEDLREIFGSVGELKTVSIHYDAANKPKGTAEVVYRARAGAEAAVREFDGREVEDVRIRVRIVGDGGSSGGAAGGAGAGAHGHAAAHAAAAHPAHAAYAMGAPASHASQFAHLASAAGARGGSNRELTMAAR